MASTSSLLTDFLLRASGIANLYGPVFEGLPRICVSALADIVARKYLCLNCLTSSYAPLWEEVTGESWTENIPLRKARERRAAQNDIDAIVAISLGVTADELCMIYRTQFPVMRRYDQEDHFDINGRKVPSHIIKLHLREKGAENLTPEQRTWQHPQSNATYTFEYPFVVLDREVELHAAYEHFSQVITP